MNEQTETETGAELASPTQQPVVINKECVWEEVHEGMDDITTETGCGNKHMFIEGSVADNNYEYCPYCGGQIMITVELGDVVNEYEGDWDGMADQTM